MESLWVYEEFVEFPVIKPKPSPAKNRTTHASFPSTFITPATLVAGLFIVWMQIKLYVRF